MGNRESVRPVEIKLLDASGIRLAWSDGHESIYPLNLLRDRCPCASCRGPQKSLVPPHAESARPAGSVRLLEVSPVGRYALRFLWRDGHDTGIYTYEYLRSLCRCELCRA